MVYLASERRSGILNKLNTRILYRSESQKLNKTLEGSYSVPTEFVCFHINNNNEIKNAVVVVL